MFRKDIDILILSFNNFLFFIYVCQFNNDFVLVRHFKCISSSQSTEKMHRLLSKLKEM